jgi:hypothetical protein
MFDDLIRFQGSRRVFAFSMPEHTLGSFAARMGCSPHTRFQKDRLLRRSSSDRKWTLSPTVSTSALPFLRACLSTRQRRRVRARGLQDSAEITVLCSPVPGPGGFSNTLYGLLKRKKRLVFVGLKITTLVPVENVVQFVGESVGVLWTV